MSYWPFDQSYKANFNQIANLVKKNETKEKVDSIFKQDKWKLFEI